MKHVFSLAFAPKALVRFILPVDKTLGHSSSKSVPKIYSVEPSVNHESFSGNPEGKRFRSGMKESQGFWL